MKVFIMGNRGRMGKLLTDLFNDLGHEVKKSFKSENIDDHKSMKNTYEERMDPT